MKRIRLFWVLFLTEYKFFIQRRRGIRKVSKILPARLLPTFADIIQIIKGIGNTYSSLNIFVQVFYPTDIHNSKEFVGLEDGQRRVFSLEYLSTYFDEGLIIIMGDRNDSVYTIKKALKIEILSNRKVR